MFIPQHFKDFTTSKKKKTQASAVHYLEHEKGTCSSLTRDKEHVAFCCLLNGSFLQGYILNFTTTNKALGLESFEGQIKTGRKKI